VRREKFDVILLDVSMPGMSGDDVCRYIKASMPGPRVVAFTAHVMPDEVDSIMSAGFDGLLTKPFSQEQLIASLWST
jgi:CheY-like chemotaxis protein